MKKILVASMMLASMGANATDLGSIDAVRNALKDTYHSIQQNSWGTTGYDEGALALGVVTNGIADLGAQGQVSIEVRDGRFTLTATNFRAPTDAEIDAYLTTERVDTVVDGVMNDVFGTDDLSGNNFINNADGVLSVAAGATDGLIAADFTTGLNSVNAAVVKLNEFGSSTGDSIENINTAITNISTTFQPIVNKANAILDNLDDAVDTFGAIDQNHYNNYRVDSYTITNNDTGVTSYIIPLGTLVNGVEQCYVSTTSEAGAYEQYAKAISTDCPTT